MKIGDRVFINPPQTPRFQRFGIWGTVEQFSDDNDNIYVSYDDGAGSWYLPGDLDTTDANYSERLRTRPKLSLKSRKFTGITGSLDEQCEAVWGKNFTKSWQMRPKK